jgi:hypothetical protein
MIVTATVRKTAPNRSRSWDGWPERMDSMIATAIPEGSAGNR